MSKTPHISESDSIGLPKAERISGPSHDLSNVEGVQIFRGIPAEESERLRELTTELRRRIGRLGLDDRLRLLEIMKNDFPDSMLDTQDSDQVGSTPRRSLTIQTGSAWNEVPMSPMGDDF